MLISAWLVASHSTEKVVGAFSTLINDFVDGSEIPSIVCSVGFVFLRTVISGPKRRRGGSSDKSCCSVLWLGKKHIDRVCVSELIELSKEMSMDVIGIYVCERSFQ